MAGAVKTTLGGKVAVAPPQARAASRGRRVVRAVLIGITVLFLGVFIVVPAVNVFAQAFSNGVGAYFAVFDTSATPGGGGSGAGAQEGGGSTAAAGAPTGLSKEERDLRKDRRAALREARKKKRQDAARAKAEAEATAKSGQNPAAGPVAGGASAPEAGPARRELPPPSPELTWSSIRMTLGVAAVAVPLNVLFGIAAAWAITKFRFRGRSLLVSLIDLPFSVSPVVAGLVFVLLFGASGYFGDWATNFRWPHPASLYWRGFDESWWPFGATRWETGIIFTPIAIVLASAFVTFPFVARSLIPLMESQGVEEEQAAVTLGAGGWTTFWRVTLPNIKWGLLYGVILCTARAFGEFGAVSVVSGHRERNDTMPLRIERLWQDTRTQAAFAVASLLACLAFVTLLAKAFIEWRTAERPRVEDDAPPATTAPAPGAAQT